MESSFSYKLLAFLTSFTSWQAYVVILGVLFACGLGVPIPEDITLVAAGVLAGVGTISLSGAIIAGLIGVMVGDSFMYFLGKTLGQKTMGWISQSPLILPLQEVASGGVKAIREVTKVFFGKISNKFWTALDHKNMPGKRDLNLTLRRSEEFLREQSQKIKEKAEASLRDSENLQDSTDAPAIKE